MPGTVTVCGVAPCSRQVSSVAATRPLACAFVSYRLTLDLDQRGGRQTSCPSGATRPYWQLIRST